MRDTAHLSLVEHGAYTVLLDTYYATARPLPQDLGELYRICRSTTAIERKAVDKIANTYFPIAEDGFRHNGRADAEIAKQEKQAAINREIGSRGGRPIQTEQQTDSVTDSVNKQEPNKNPNQSQSQKELKNLGRASRSTRLETASLPDEWRSFCIEERPDLSPENIWVGFRDYWIAVPGNRGLKLDWFATWRNWCRNQRGSGKPVQKITVDA